MRIVIEQEIITFLLFNTADNFSIYHLSITAPNRDFVTSIGIQDAFVRELRNILERIKNDNPAVECIHIFPAMPNSLAVRMGMDFMPKADLLWLAIFARERDAS